MYNPLAASAFLRIDGRRKFAAENLKRCPLCGAVNAKQNAECFLCAWHGEFEYELESVEEGLEELLERCPELAELLVELPECRRPIRDFFVNLWRRLIHRGHVDIWA